MPQWNDPTKCYHRAVPQQQTTNKQTNKQTTTNCSTGRRCNGETTPQVVVLFLSVGKCQEGTLSLFMGTIAPTIQMVAVQFSILKCFLQCSAVPCRCICIVIVTLQSTLQCSSVYCTGTKRCHRECSVECCRAERRGGMAGHSIWLLAGLHCNVLHLHFYSYATILIRNCSQPTVRFWWARPNPHPPALPLPTKQIFPQTKELGL